MINSKRSLFAVIILGLVVIALVVRLDLFATSSNVYQQVQRFIEALQVVDKLYVEEVDPEKLVDGAIEGMLEKLDPHSVYITRDELVEITEQFDGEFEGIGIEFIVHDKYPLIISPIADSPSERVGLHSGDRIVEIEGKSTYGIDEDGVREKLLGRKGTQVNLTIDRPNNEEPFEVTITRDRIPVYSVTTAFPFDAETGYIRVGRFARTTNEEFVAALDKLQAAGMRRLILDLRGNSGGYLNQAVEMVDHFFADEQRIVYTRGRIESSSEDYFSTGSGAFQNLPLIVMIDHGSASASEIVAGAIQDWDRGLIVGQTSFGKGLVQNQISLKDGSAIRVTVARYYTPSGRLIQRAYNNGFDEYIAEAFDDEDPNDQVAVEADSSDKPVFETNAGRKVYGGGGISPDIVLTPTKLSATTIKFIQNQVFFQYGARFAEGHRQLAGDFDHFLRRFVVTPEMVDELIADAQSKVTPVPDDLQKDMSFIKRRIKSEVARHLWNSQEYYQVEALGDRQVQDAVSHFPEAVKIAHFTRGSNGK